MWPSHACLVVGALKGRSGGWAVFFFFFLFLCAAWLVGGFVVRLNRGGGMCVIVCFRCVFFVWVCGFNVLRFVFFSLSGSWFLDAS